MSTILFQPQGVNSLWSSDTIRRQGTESTLAQVMACCLMAPSHYVNQCWLIISKVLWHSLGALSWQDPKIPIWKVRLKITFLEYLSDLPGANELKSFVKQVPSPICIADMQLTSIPLLPHLNGIICGPHNQEMNLWHSAQGSLCHKLKLWQKYVSYI